MFPMSKRKRRHFECNYIVPLYLQSVPVGVSTGQFILENKKIRPQWVVTQDKLVSVYLLVT